MNAEAIVTVSAAVVALVQLVKWAGLPDKAGALAVLLFAAIGVAMWAYSQLATFDRTLIWPLFAGWITVATSAAGVFGFTRATAGAVTNLKSPPAGAGQSATAKE